MKITFLSLLILAIQLHYNAVNAQYLVGNSVFSNGGTVMTDPENYKLNGTIGQVMIGITTSEVNINKLGFWYTLSNHATNIQSPYSNFQQSIELYQNYPNPFNRSTIIEYSLNEEAFISLKIYDILGREISVLFNGIKEAGHYSVRFDASGLAWGVYICRLQSDDIILTKKMFMLK